MNKEFYERFDIEEKKLDKEIEDFLQNKGTFDENLTENMPGTWVRFKFRVSVSRLKFALLK